MEGNTDKTQRPGLPTRPFSSMGPSTLPLAVNSFQVWKRPYSFSHVGGGPGSSGAKNDMQPSDLNTFTPSSDTDEMNKTSQNSSPSFDSNPTSHVNAAADDNSFKTEAETVLSGGQVDSDMDPRKLKRLMSNRVSAQKSRLKKLQYLADLEKRVKSLENQVAVLAPQVEQHKSHRHFLQMEQKSLKQQLANHEDTKILREAEIEYNKREVARLRQLHLNQYHERMQKLRAKMHGEGPALGPMVNSGLDRPDFGHTAYMNPNQAQYGGTETEMNKLSLFEQHPNPGLSLGGWEPRQMPNPGFKNQVSASQQDSDRAQNGW